MSMDNHQIELAPGVTKPLGECTQQDLLVAQELLMARAARLATAAGDGHSGQPLRCDFWIVAERRYCESESSVLRLEGDPSDPLALCAVHARALNVRVGVRGGAR